MFSKRKRLMLSLIMIWQINVVCIRPLLTIFSSIMIWFNRRIISSWRVLKPNLMIGKVKLEELEKSIKV